MAAKPTDYRAKTPNNDGPIFSNGKSQTSFADAPLENVTFHSGLTLQSFPLSTTPNFKLDMRLYQHLNWRMDNRKNEP